MKFLFFLGLIVFAFGQDQAPSTQSYCYEEIKNGDKLVGFKKTLKTEDDCTEDQPDLKASYICINTGKQGTQCDWEDSDFQSAQCYIANGQCIKMDDDYYIKITIQGETATISNYVDEACTEQPQSDKTDTQTCGECKNKVNNAEQFECHIKDDGNNDNTPKQSYCYEKIKNGDKLVGFTKTLKTGDQCPSNQQETQPDLKASYVCVNYGKEGSECEWEDSDLETAQCYIANGQCIKFSDDGSKKITIKNNVATLLNYRDDKCKDNSQDDKEDTANCGECNDKNSNAVYYSCNVSDDDNSGALETTILLLVACILFFF